MDLKQLERKLLPEKLAEKLERIEYQYFLDQREFGKIMIVASLTILVFALHGLSQLNGILDTTHKLEEDFNRLSIVVNSAQFNSSLEALQSIQTSNIGGQFGFAAQLMRATKERLNSFSRTNSQLERLQRSYQWMILISILGLTTGVTTMYI